MDDVKRSPDQRSNFKSGVDFDAAMQRRQAFLDARVQAARYASFASRNAVDPVQNTPNVMTDLRRQAPAIVPQITQSRPAAPKPVMTAAPVRTERQLSIERHRVAPDIGQFIAHKDLSLIPPAVTESIQTAVPVVRTRDDLLEQLSTRNYQKVVEPIQSPASLQAEIKALTEVAVADLTPDQSNFVEHIEEHEPKTALWRHELNRARNWLGHYRLTRRMAPKTSWLFTRTLIVLAMVWVVILSIQFAMPGGFVAKSIAYEGLVFSGQQPQRAATGIDTLRSAEQITLTTAGDRAVSTQVGDGIVKVDVVSLKQSVSEFGALSRLKPGSVLGRTSETVEPKFAIDQQSQDFKTLVETLSTDLDQAGKAPAVTFDEKSGVSRVVPGVEAVTHDRQEVANKVLALLNSSQQAKDTVNFTMSSTAKSTESELAKKSEAYNSAMTQKFVVKIDNVDMEIAGADLSKLLTPVYFPENSAQTVDQAVSDLANKISKTKSVSAKNTVVTLSQGSEISRQQGSAGKAVAPAVLAAAIKQTIATGTVAAIKSQAVEPAVTTQNTIPAAPSLLATSVSNDQGLADVISQATLGRGDIGVTVQEISGQGRRASVNGTKEYVTASTYKLLLTYSISKKLDSGSWKWNTRISNTTLDKCFDKMIVVSDNTCASAFGFGVGWLNSQNQLKELGLKNTFMNNVKGDKHSTTEDEELFIRKVATESILRQDVKDRLWDTGARQIYRSGIPAGSRNAKVVDKVGFYAGYLNDTGVVYGQKSTYTISIMTKDSSWQNIAYVAEKIYDYLNQ